MNKSKEANTKDTFISRNRNKKARLLSAELINYFAEVENHIPAELRKDMVKRLKLEYDDLLGLFRKKKLI